MWVTLVLAVLSGIVLPFHGQGPAAQTPEPVVHAILFYSPTCPHCRKVIAEDLVPLKNRYGDRLILLTLDTSSEFGGQLFRAALDHYDVPQNMWAVPFMIVQDQILVGSLDIPARFPVILEGGLAGDGIGLPAIPMLLEFLEARGELEVREPGRRYVYRIPDGQRMTAEEPTSEEAAAEAAEGEEAAQPVQGMAAADVATSEEGPREEARGEERAAETGRTEEAAPDAVAREAGASGTGDVGAVTAGRELAGELAEGPREAEAETERDLAASEGSRKVAADDPLDLERAARHLEDMTPWQRFAQDRSGNTLSLVVLLVMLLTVAMTVYPPARRGADWPRWAIPALAGVGLVVALYLSYVELTETPAVCGPVGDCNTVQQSPYARLFGILPVGVLGALGYLTIFSLWIVIRRARGPVRRSATLALWAVALMGTLFSIYLTFVEPFVIGATCAWCLTSAVVMTLLLWASAAPASLAWRGEA